MKQRIRMIQQGKDEGFTLVELLIVIVVLGILAGIVVLGLGAFRDDAETAACEADVKQVSTALDALAARGSALPASGATDALVTAKLLKSEPATAMTWDADGNVSATC